MGGACSAYVGQERPIQGLGGANQMERDHLEDEVVDRRIILRWIFRKWDGRAWAGLMWLRIGTGGGLL